MITARGPPPLDLALLLRPRPPPVPGPLVHVVLDLGQDVLRALHRDGDASEVRDLDLVLQLLPVGHPGLGVGLALAQPGPAVGLALALARPRAVGLKGPEPASSELLACRAARYQGPVVAATGKH